MGRGTARRFFRCNPPSVFLDGDMPGFVKAMFNGLVDHPNLPPPASTVEPPTRQLKIPLWTLPRRAEGESSRSAMSKRSCIEDGDRYDSEVDSNDEDEYDDGHELDCNTPYTVGKLTE